MDSLGGILINGLLGNPILARFGLFWGAVNVEIIERESSAGAANTTHIRGPNRQTPKTEKYVRITISVNNRVVQKTYPISDGFAKISINIVNSITKLGVSIKSIFVRKQVDSANPTVRIKND